MKHLYDAPPALLEQVIRLQIVPLLKSRFFGRLIAE
jgi:hypothetical protein